MASKKTKKTTKKTTKKSTSKRKTKKSIERMSTAELRDLVMVQNYKLTVARAQIEALVEILRKNKITTYEEFWKLTKKYLDEMIL